MMRILAATLLSALALGTLGTASGSPTAAAAAVPATQQSPDQRDWETLESSSAPLQARADAAKLLAARAKKGPEPAKAAARFDALGAKFATDAQLRRILAECIATCDSPDTQKMLARSMGSGQSFEKLFRLRAARGCAPGVVDEAVLKLLADKDGAVRREALDVLVHHKHMPAVKVLESVLKSGKDEALLGPAIDAVSQLVGQGEGWSAWETQLLGHARATHDEMRRAALSVLARAQDPARLELFLDTLKHDDWSSRAIALSWLVRSNSKEAVAAIIERFQAEPPGSRLAADCGDTLRKMTGQPLGDDPQAWATWWGNVRATFEFPKATGPRTPGAKRPVAHSGTEAPQFYGIEIRSKRVVFVIDVSGSMEASMGGSEYQGASRMEAARRELVKIIEALPPGSLFNIISFSDAVVPWLDHVEAAADVASGGKGGARKGPSTGPKKEDTRDEKAKARDAQKQKEADELLRKKATEYVNRLNARGGTNIHDAFEAAFEDPYVDTIFFLSDGIPSTGKEVDPVAIRDVVKRWNETRRLKINCVAIGIELPLLSWIAEDAGGEYKFFP
ncbi:MAG: VWA domain-containing protein [Planctomycetes bacterium]|nr:VWA domain-containing protein [Planctomycetota bacterium]